VAASRAKSNKAFKRREMTSARSLIGGHAATDALSALLGAA